MNGEDRQPSPRDLIDQSKLHIRRARKSIVASNERVARTRHDWSALAVGRVCTLCHTAQATNEFDESVPCKSA